MPADDIAALSARHYELALEVADLTRKRAASRGRTRAAIETKLSSVTGALTDALNRWKGGILQLADPCAAPGAVPLLLLPVRIETRFGPVAGPAILRVRIFPDVVHHDRLHRALTPAEQEAGAIWAASDRGDAAWTGLVTTCGMRAPWVARVASGVEGPAPPSTGSVARLLPDRFVVEVHQGGKLRRVTGNPIGADVPMGLFEENHSENALTEVDGIPVAPGAEWIVDYGAAEQKGLAVTIPLKARDTVERVVVYGIRSDAPAATAAVLEDLLESHHFSQGLGFVAPGTATNNLSDTAAGSAPAAGRPVPDAPAIGSDGAKLAAALGISPGVFAGVQGSDQTADADAQAANTVLWWPTIGAFLDMIEGAERGDQVSNAEVLWARALHRDVVRGRGTLPSLRIGKQPYGVLAVTDLDNLSGHATSRALLARSSDQAWSAVAGLPRLGNGSGTPVTAMRELLGTSAVSWGVKARVALSGPALQAMSADDRMEKTIASLLWQQLNQAQYSVPVGSLSAKANAVHLPYADDSDTAALQQLADGKALPSPQSVLQALAALAATLVRKRSSISPVTSWSNVFSKSAMSGVRDLNEDALVKAQAAGPHAMHALADRLDALAGGAGETVSLRKLEQVTGRHTSLVELAQTTGATGISSDFLRAALAEISRRSAEQVEFDNALRHLATVSVEARALVVGEALDVASHRIDAWATAFAAERGAAVRAGQPKGIAVGAFGWVDDVRVTPDAAPCYVHTPSIAHAATAGILRAAYQAHAAEGGAGYAVDLSSRRVRLASDLLAARREGQTLGEALGYRLERMMQDAKLGQYILGMRAAFPGAGTGAASGGADTVALYAVTDGAKLVEAITRDGADAVRARVEAKPQNAPDLEGVPWSPIVGPARISWDRIVTWISEALDAVGDLLMAESVHQLAQGNTARAAAAADVITGDGSPPDFGVIGAAPRASVLAHRVLIVVGGVGWPHKGPRALAAPEVEAWAAARLGNPATIIAAVMGADPPVSLSGAPMSALDLVFETADRESLVTRLRALTGLPPGAAYATTSEPGWPAEWRALGEVFDLADAMRATLARCRPALAADLALPDSPTGSNADGLATVRGRLREAALGLKAVRDAGGAGCHTYGILAPTDATDLQRAILREIDRRLQVAAPLLSADPTSEALLGAARALFGDGFVIAVPIVPGAEWAAAQASAPAPRLRRWLSDMGSVREPIGAFLDGVMLAEALGHTLVLSTARLLHPVETDSPDEHDFPDFAGDRPPGRVAVSMVIETMSGSGDGAVAALVVDDFTEAVDLPGDVTSAIAMNPPAPDARPPQTMLFALCPDGGDWTTERLSSVLASTRRWVALRGVTLERLPLLPRALPAIYTRSASLQGEPVLDWSIATTAVAASAVGAASLHNWAFVKDEA